MKAGLICLLLAGLLGGCGKSSGGGSESAAPSTVYTYSPEFMNGYAPSCVKSAQASVPQFTDAQASSYCSCSIEAAENLWTEEYFGANEALCTQALTDNGSLKKCADAALAK